MELKPDNQQGPGWEREPWGTEESGEDQELEEVQGTIVSYSQQRNDFSLSAEVKVTPDGTALQVRIDQKRLIAQDFTTIISALTRLHTQFWLIQQGRLPDLDEYAKTQGSRFVEEANLIITEVTYHSPALITLLTDPATATAVVTSTVTLALQKVVDTIVHVRKQFLSTRNEEVKMKTEQLKSVLATVRELVDTLYPGADQETKTKAMQSMLPKIEEIISELLKPKRKHA